MISVVDFIEGIDDPKQSLVPISGPEEVDALAVQRREEAVRRSDEILRSNTQQAAMKKIIIRFSCCNLALIIFNLNNYFPETVQTSSISILDLVYRVCSVPRCPPRPWLKQ